MAITAPKKENSADKLTILLNKNSRTIKIVILLAVLAVGYWLMIGPRLSQLIEAQNSLLPKKKAELQSLNDFVDKMTQLQTIKTSQDQNFTNQLNRIEKILPTQPEISELIAQFNTIAQNNNFKLTNIQFNESLNQAKVKTSKLTLAMPKTNPVATTTAAAVNTLENSNVVNIDITATVSGGDYFSMKKLLSDLETNLRLVDIKSISFTSSAEKASFNLSLTAYYLPQQNVSKEQ